MKNNKSKIIKKRKKNSGGFTLVELLATIAILSLVSVIVIYTATNILNNAKDKSYLVTINNIQKESGTYVLENDKNIVWLSDGGDYLYQCVSVQNLIDMGYFENNILDSKINEDRNVLSNDYIYIEKDKGTKTITKQILLYDDISNLRRLCGDYVNANGSIIVDVPSGWAKSKDVVITYKLDSSIGDATNYKYDYMYDAFNDSSLDISYKSFGFTTIMSVSKKITVYDEGVLYANIKKNNNEIVFPISVEVGKIDTVGPEITESASNQIVRGSVTIPMKIIDNESGVDASSISLSDFKVSIGGNILTSGVNLTKVGYDTAGEEINYYNYNLNISDRYYAGEVKIEIEDGQIKDKLGNGNKKITLSTGVIFDNTYTIKYHANGGAGSMNNTTCTYGVNCQLLTNSFARTGYTFLGWSTNKNATSTMYIDEYKFEPFKLEDDMILYAIWKPNTYTITYRLGNGSSTGGSAVIGTDSCTYDSECTLKVWSSFNKTFPNNSNGWKFAGWSLSTSGTNIEFVNKKAFTYTYSKDIILYAVGSRNFKFYSGNPVKELSSQLQYWNPYSTNDSYLTSINIPTSTEIDGWSFVGYRATDDASSTVTFSRTGSNKPDADSLTAFSFRTIYKRDVSIKYDKNGGNGTVTSTKGTQYYNSGISSTGANVSNPSLKLASNGFTYNGYTFLGWSTSSTATSASYEPDDSYSFTNGVSSSNTVTMYAIWKINKVHIKYSKKDGSVTSTTTEGSTTYNWTTDSNDIIYRNNVSPYQSINYGGKLGSSGLNDYNNGNYLNITRTGYHGKSGAEWKCLDGCTTSGNTYSHNSVYEAKDFCDASVSDCTVILGVNWEANTYTISYNKNGGSGSMSNSTCTYDSNCSISANSYTREGYTFLGWTTNSDGTDDGYNWTGWSDKWTYVNGQYGISSNKLTLYARWKINDTEAPTCTISVSSDGITFGSTSDNIGVTSSYLSTSSNALSGSSSLTLSKGTKYGFVKDAAGNVGTCSVEIFNTYVSSWQKTTKTCSAINNGYTKISKVCTKQVLSYTCAAAANVTSKSYSCSGFTKPKCLDKGCSWKGSYCSGSYSVTVWTCPSDSTNMNNGQCERYNQSTCGDRWGIYSTNYSYSWGDSETESVKTCQPNNILCNSTTVNQSNVTCVDKFKYDFVESTSPSNSCNAGTAPACNSTTVGSSYVSSCSATSYACSSGTKVNWQYCYK